MSQSHIGGYPRIGRNRELKFALEAYWKGETKQPQLEQVGRQLRHENWQAQHQAGLDHVTVGDFAWYDHILATSCLFGVIPARHRDDQLGYSLDTQFRMARGRAPSGPEAPACAMTKWFNTNYHYIVPEFEAEQQFELLDLSFLEQIAEAQQQGYRVKPVLVGPLTYLWQGRLNGTISSGSEDKPQDDKLALLPRLVDAYLALFDELSAQKIDWLQLDEPILALDLPKSWQRAFERAYRRLGLHPLKMLLAGSYGSVAHHYPLIRNLPVAGLHLDACADRDQIALFAESLADHQVLSVGAISGRQIWRADLNDLQQWLSPLARQLGSRLWLGSSCSLQHVPCDLERETELPAELRDNLAFAKEKLEELTLLNAAVSGRLSATQQARLDELAQSSATHRNRAATGDSRVRQRLAKLTADDYVRHSPFESRRQAQRTQLNLPVLPTTTIGSFPQTQEIRSARAAYRGGRLSEADYKAQMQQHITQVIRVQEEIGLDVLVHGEAERNDMVEYFGKLLDGIAISRLGWVQSYGSRCVKPPIIYADIERPEPMTVEWIRYAQSLTDKPVKGMLTGPVTLLYWSFRRDDLSDSECALQLALAIRDEVADLERAGVNIIQIDEPALREGLPLRQRDWDAYLQWATDSFRLSAAEVADSTQIHTHMCYAEFNDIISAVAAMDADVITIETSRNNMALLEAFEKFDYPNEIGPGVYDIHSPNVPGEEWIVDLLEKAAARIPAERLWVNPDCGLKTRAWPETLGALKVMVAAAAKLRERLAVEA